MPDDPDPAAPLHRTQDPAPGARKARTLVVLGIDGAGKTTAALALVAAERMAGRPAVLVRNPAGRRWLTRVADRLGVAVPALLADRFETVVRSVNVLVAHLRGALFGRKTRAGGKPGGLVVMDRHLACQLALREVRGLPQGWSLAWLEGLLPAPDDVVLLDVPAEEAYARIHARGEDHESLAYLRAARTAYLKLAAAEGWHVVDGSGTPEQVVQGLRAILR
ncbi:hypothetical protein NCCP1664_12520 [Zafaria cholistanensis]|uniref:Thymidylate kinase n=1 Tax=Zafaria cholistanensis TaxID=1682741 RepID=A0A5A7NPR7_9MICC|nr:thymidylate kinase [Zafaria cholistanensis]GER22755.1 hypothetical protein NCCP1664_12520 [Zafaria cholistanensis]